MFQVMVVISGSLGKQYAPVALADKKADAEREKEALAERNPGYKFAIMDED